MKIIKGFLGMSRRLKLLVGRSTYFDVHGFLVDSGAVMYHVDAHASIHAHCQAHMDAAILDSALPRLSVVGIAPLFGRFAMSSSTARPNFRMHGKRSAQDHLQQHLVTARIAFRMGGKRARAHKHTNRECRAAHFDEALRQFISGPSPNC